MGRGKPRSARRRDQDVRRGTGRVHRSRGGQRRRGRQRRRLVDRRGRAAGRGLEIVEAIDTDEKYGFAFAQGQPRVDGGRQRGSAGDHRRRYVRGDLQQVLPRPPGSGGVRGLLGRGIRRSLGGIGARRDVNGRRRQGRRRDAAGHPRPDRTPSCGDPRHGMGLDRCSPSAERCSSRLLQALSGPQVTQECVAEGIEPDFTGAGGVCNIVDAFRSRSESVVLILAMVMGVVSYRRRLLAVPAHALQEDAGAMHRRRRPGHTGPRRGSPVVVPPGELGAFVRLFFNFEVLKGYGDEFLRGAQEHPHLGFRGRDRRNHHRARDGHAGVVARGRSCAPRPSCTSTSSVGRRSSGSS